jgi:hypothetical protein
MPWGSKVKHTLQITYFNKTNKKKKSWTQVPVTLLVAIKITIFSNLVLFMTKDEILLT